VTVLLLSSYREKVKSFNFLSENLQFLDNMNDVNFFSKCLVSYQVTQLWILKNYYDLICNYRDKIVDVCKMAV
jgi:hypothetical protein